MTPFQSLNIRLQAFAVLSERGPLRLEELATELEQRGGFLRCGLESLRKALNRGPYRTNLQGEVALDPDHRDFWYDEVRVKEKLSPALPKPVAPPLSEAPITAAELERYDPPPALSQRKRLMLCLDAFGPLELRALPEPALRFLGGEPDVKRSLAGRDLPLALEGSCLVSQQHYLWRELRLEVRAALRAATEREIEREALRARRQERQEQEEQTRAAFVSARRCLIRVLADGDELAGSILHLNEMSFQDFQPKDRDHLLRSLDGLDVVIGLEPRALYEQLGLDPGSRKFVDLTPPFKERKLNRAGRRVHFGVSQAIAMTVSSSQPLGDLQKLAAYREQGQWGKFFRRTQSDVKSLYQYYRYGVEHNSVRLRWGFLDELVGVNWNLGEEPGIYEILRCAHEQGTSVDVVLGGTPGFEDRFSRARPFWPARFGLGWVEGTFGDLEWKEVLMLPDIMAARPSLDARLVSALG